ncbi:phage tail terminator-like protein [Sphingomonas aquatilis]
MPATQTTDWLALKARIDTLATNPTMPVFDPGAIVMPPKDATGALPYILLSDVTNDPVRGGISGVPSIRSGTLMLSVMWPLAREIAHTQLREIAGQIAAHFPEDLCISYGPSRLRVTQDSAAMQSYVDGAYRVSVVRVVWSSV